MQTHTSSISGTDREVRTLGAAANACCKVTETSKRAWMRGAWAALTAGSRAIPLGDNGALFRELAERIAVPNRCS
jgi:hypothetical protein